MYYSCIWQVTKLNIKSLLPRCNYAYLISAVYIKHMTFCRTIPCLRSIVVRLLTKSQTQGSCRMIVQQTYVPCDVRPKNVDDFARSSHVRTATVLRIARKPWGIHRIVLRPSKGAVRWSFALRNKMYNSQRNTKFEHFPQRWQPYYSNCDLYIQNGGVLI